MSHPTQSTIPLGYQPPPRRARLRINYRRLLPRAALAACVSAVLLAYLAAAGCGRGGRGYFSPDTLECRTHPEWLLPPTKIPLYRGRSSMHRWPVADYLVAQGFWSRSDTPDPRWLPTSRWNQQWNDGQSLFHRELGWRGEWWVEWSEKNPEMAKALWPKVLVALRRPGTTNTAEAAGLLFAAQQARSVEEFDKLSAEMSAERAAARTQR